jgi:hypothetical protein
MGIDVLDIKLLEGNRPYGIWQGGILPIVPEGIGARHNLNNRKKDQNQQ